MTPIERVREALECITEEHQYIHSQASFLKLQAKVEEIKRELEGMVLVPAKPTREMIKSAWTAQYLTIGADMAMAEKLAEIRVNDTKQKSQDQLAYEAMIAPYVEGEKE